MLVSAPAARAHCAQKERHGSGARRQARCQAHGVLSGPAPSSVRSVDWRAPGGAAVRAPPDAAPLVLLPGFGNNSDDYERPFGDSEAAIATALRVSGRCTAARSEQGADGPTRGQPRRAGAGACTWRPSSAATGSTSAARSSRATFGRPAAPATRATGARPRGRAAHAAAPAGHGGAAGRPRQVVPGQGQGGRGRGAARVRRGAGARPPGPLPRCLRLCSGRRGARTPAPGGPGRPLRGRLAGARLPRRPARL